VEFNYFEAKADVTIDGRALKADDWNQHVADMASRLDGVDALAVETAATVDAAVAVLAGLRRGIPVIPVSPDAGPREREHVLRDSGADAVMVGSRLTSVRPIVRPLGSAALILYTSGTTGPPKGVPITTASILSCISALADAWDWTGEDTLVHGLPLHHVHGLVLGILGPLIVGSPVVHTGRPTPEAYAQAEGTLYFGVPTVWGRIAAAPTAARQLRRARLLVSGSAALPRPVFVDLAALAGQAPVERYGMTETLITVSARSDEPRVQGTVGRPIMGVSTRLVDEDGDPVGHDGRSLGQLDVRGPGVFGGYVNRPDATFESFTEDGWFCTGDIATIDADGIHRLVGRASTDLIKTGGYRVGAGEIEDCLLAHPGVAEAAVIGIPDDDLGQCIVAFVVAPGCSETDLAKHVGDELAWHKRPRRVVFVDELPRNAMGKVNKARLQ
jgi:fatty acid CoA ligase FadD36